MLRMLIFLFFTTFSYSQSRTITAVVSDDISKATRILFAFQNFKL